MVHFLDGPGAGALPLRRAPSLIRVVVGPDDKVDALDAIDDEPRPDETIHVYRIIERRGPVHVCIRGKGAAGSGWYANAYYRHDPDVDGETVRETAAWRQWQADDHGVPLQVVLDALAAERAHG